PVGAWAYRLLLSPSLPSCTLFLVTIARYSNTRACHGRPSQPIRSYPPGPEYLVPRFRCRPNSFSCFCSSRSYYSDQILISSFMIWRSKQQDATREALPKPPWWPPDCKVWFLVRQWQIPLPLVHLLSQ